VYFSIYPYTIQGGVPSKMDMNIKHQFYNF